MAVWRPKLQIYHHFLVLLFEVENGLIQIIHYAESLKYLLVAKVKTEYVFINEKSKLLDFKSGLYIIERTSYPKTDFEKVVALSRAESRLGEVNYRLVDNNCETFVTWILTGQGQCEQFENCGAGKRALADSVDAAIADGRKLKGPDVGIRVYNAAAVNFLTKSGDKLLDIAVAKSLGEVVKTTSKVGPSAVTAGVATGITVAIAAPIEAAFCGHEIYKLHKELKQKRIDKKGFKRAVTKNIAGSTSSVAASAGASFLGMFIGQIACPIPVVGAAIGGAVGGIVGSVVGRVTGSAVSGKIFDAVTK